MSIKKLKSPSTKGINVSNERVESEKINEIIDYLNANSENEPKKFIAFLTQTGLNDPQVTIVLNTFDSTPVITRDDVGTYFVTLAGVFTENKTILNPENHSADTFGKIIMERASEDLVTITSYDELGAAVDDMLFGNWIQIEVYNN